MSKSYSDKLKHPKWQRLRLEVMKRDKFCCKLCKDKDDFLNVHHLRYTADEPYNEPKINLITLCEKCHGFIEYLKKIKIQMPESIIKMKGILETESIFICFYKGFGVMIYEQTYKDYLFVKSFKKECFGKIIKEFKRICK